MSRSNVQTRGVHSLSASTPLRQGSARKCSPFCVYQLILFKESFSLHCNKIFFYWSFYPRGPAPFFLKQERQRRQHSWIHFTAQVMTQGGHEDSSDSFGINPSLSDSKGLTDVTPFWVSITGLSSERGHLAQGSQWELRSSQCSDGRWLGPKGRRIFL